MREKKTGNRKKSLEAERREEGEERKGRRRRGRGKERKNGLSSQAGHKEQSFVASFECVRKRRRNKKKEEERKKKKRDRNQDN